MYRITVIITGINILIIRETASVHYLFIKENSGVFFFFEFTLGLPIVTRSLAQTFFFSSPSNRAGLTFKS